MSTETRQMGYRCEKGHNMDPTWDKCPYCEAEKNADQRSESDAPYLFTRNSVGRRTHIQDIPDGLRGHASVHPSPVPSGMGDTQMITGVLITYSWHLSGDIFHVRLGKNFIGAGRRGNHPTDPLCDFLVEQDEYMSSVHALILCRQGSSAKEIQFYLMDQQSTNGTYLNGEMIPLEGVTLPNYAKIITGDTEWTFIHISP